MTPKKLIFALFAALLTVGLVPQAASAQDGRIRLNNNAGVTSDVWEIQGEPSLVINGFDLTPTSLRLPAVIESASIDLVNVIPNSVYDVVVYQDPNGGSPVDAELVGFEQVTFTDAGVQTVQFDPPAVVSASVVWIGFYMPVGTEFRSDGQGTSVLTYWAWTPENTFNLSDLSSAQVLGPSDGSDPVLLDIGGIARITGVASAANPTTITDTSANVAREYFSGADAERATDYLTNYEGCPTLFFDTATLTSPIREPSPPVAAKSSPGTRHALPPA